MTQDGNGKPLRIYVAGPINAPSQRSIMKNVDIACRITEALIDKGHYPYTPHLLLYLNCPGKDWAFWMDFDDQWLQQCEALYYVGPSRGADIELSRAKELGLQVFYSLDEVLDLKGGTGIE